MPPERLVLFDGGATALSAEVIEEENFPFQRGESDVVPPMVVSLHCRDSSCDGDVLVIRILSYRHVRHGKVMHK